MFSVKQKLNNKQQTIVMSCLAVNIISKDTKPVFYFYCNRLLKQLEARESLKFFTMKD